MEAEAARLAEWNERCREKFGFPFIICMRRHSKESIFAEFERRLGCTPADELHAALDEVSRITALRLVLLIVVSMRSTQPYLSYILIVELAKRCLMQVPSMRVEN